MLLIDFLHFHDETPVVLRNYYLLAANGLSCRLIVEGTRSKTALDDGVPKRDNSQGLQPTASGGYLGDDLMDPMASQPPVICVPVVHADG
jgi:hypothetical protein